MIKTIDKNANIQEAEDIVIEIGEPVIPEIQEIQEMPRPNNANDQE